MTATASDEPTADILANEGTASQEATVDALTKKNNIVLTSPWAAASSDTTGAVQSPNVIQDEVIGASTEKMVNCKWV